MTESEQIIAAALGQCSFLPGSWDKRFIRDIARISHAPPIAKLTPLQLTNLCRMAHKYRWQLSSEITALAASIAPEANHNGGDNENMV